MTGARIRSDRPDRPESEFFALPGDAEYEVMWGCRDDEDLQQLVQEARAVARGTVARLVVEGQRATCQWTPEKQQFLNELDQLGVTRVLTAPGTPRYELGLQTKEDALHRLVDVWATGQAACALGFAAAQRFDSYARLAAEHWAGTVAFLTDLCYVQAARAAGEVVRICSELVFGYARHPTWDGGCEHCMNAGELDLLEGLIRGVSMGGGLAGDVIEEDRGHAPKAGPCVSFEGLQKFNEQRQKLDGCLTGARLAKDRAAAMLIHVAIPDSLDYPR